MMPNPSDPIRVVVIDDHPYVRSAIIDLVKRDPAIQVIADGGDGITAVRLAKELKPDVLLLDMEIPGKPGYVVIEELHAEGCPVQIIVLSSYDDREYIRQSIINGAAGYLTKDEAPGLVVDAIKGVAGGKRGWFSKKVLKQLPVINL